MTVQVEALSPIRDDYAGQVIIMAPGDRLTVPAEWAHKACGNGWAKDLSGTIPTAETKAETTEVNVLDMVQDQRNDPSARK